MPDRLDGLRRHRGLRSERRLSDFGLVSGGGRIRIMAEALHGCDKIRHHRAWGMETTEIHA